MKKIISSYYDCINLEMKCEKIMIGFGYEINPINKSIKKAIKKGSTNINDIFVDDNKLNPAKIYALYIDENNCIDILNADEILTMMILNGRDLYFV